MLFVLAMRFGVKIGWSIVWVLLALASPAFAQLGRTQIFLSSAAGENRAAGFLSVGDFGQIGGSAPLDYAVFVTELAAYLTKEILPDSHDEFDRSLLGSHWSRSMPENRSAFGSHCLMIVTQLGSALPVPSASVLGALREASLLDYGVQAVTAGLALHQIWSAFQNDVEDTRSGVTLQPKVSSRRVAVNVTFHW